MTVRQVDEDSEEYEELARKADIVERALRSLLNAAELPVAFVSRCMHHIHLDAFEQMAATTPMYIKQMDDEIKMLQEVAEQLRTNAPRGQVERRPEGKVRRADIDEEGADAFFENSQKLADQITALLPEGTTMLTALIAMQGVMRDLFEQALEQNHKAFAGGIQSFGVEVLKLAGGNGWIFESREEMVSAMRQAMNDDTEVARTYDFGRPPCKPTTH